MAFRHGGVLSRSMRSAFHSSPGPNPVRASGGRSSSATTSASSSSIGRPSLSPRRNPLGNDSASVRRSASPSSPLSRLPAELGGVMSMLPLAAATLTSFCLNCRSCTVLSQGEIGAGDGGWLNNQPSAILEVMLVAQDAYCSFYLEGNRLKSNMHQLTPYIVVVVNMHCNESFFACNV